MAHRFSGKGKPYEGLTKLTSHGPKWTGEVRLVPERLDQPLRWRKPRRIFVCSMSDLFHEAVPDIFIARVFAIMAGAPRHTFQVLTKQPERMKRLLGDPSEYEAGEFAIALADGLDAESGPGGYGGGWPLPNVHLGVSAENQEMLDKRVPDLLVAPAAKRFVSLEPLLAAVDTEDYLTPIDPCPGWPLGRPALDGVIVGGESGPGARPCNVEWIRSVVRQCKGAGVPVFVKQLGAEPGFKLEDEERRGNMMPSFHHGRDGLFIKKLKHPKGADPAEWPEDLRVREQPR